MKTTAYAHNRFCVIARSYRRDARRHPHPNVRWTGAGPGKRLDWPTETSRRPSDQEPSAAYTDLREKSRPGQTDRQTNQTSRRTQTYTLGRSKILPGDVLMSMRPRLPIKL